LTTVLVSCSVISPLYFPTYNEESVKLVYPDNSDGWGLLIKPADSLSNFENRWYSKHLFSLREPVLYNKTHKPKNIIRFTHLGTWGKPFSLRIEQNKSKITITYNKTNGLGGYHAGILIKHKTKKIDVEKWNMVIAKMDSIDFWNMETHDQNMVLDGEEWILEALINGRYHFVTRNCPDIYDGKGYAELCHLIYQIYYEKNSR